jgi:alpha-tubulin suppressor-like RCC1 family protein
MKSILATLFTFLALQSLLAQESLKSYSKFWAARSLMPTGNNTYGLKHFVLMRDGTLTYFAAGEKPVPFPGIDNISAISAGSDHILALKKDGTVWAWGTNISDQLGNKEFSEKNQTFSAVPVRVTGIKNAVAVSATAASSFALLADGTIWSWGDGSFGMAGDGGVFRQSGPSRPVPVQVKGITNATAISGPMALLADSTIMIWGHAYYGTLGNGSRTPTTIPGKVPGIKKAVAIAYHEYFAMALLSDGTVWAWGKNSNGKLGTAIPYKSEHGHDTPVQVKGLSNVVAHTVCLALLKDSTVKAWGWGELGGAGKGGDYVTPTPLKISGVENVVGIKAGNGHGIALLKDGTVTGWGSNMIKNSPYGHTWTPVKIAKIDR